MILSTMMRHFMLALCFVWAVTSCGVGRKIEVPKKDEPFGPTGIPPQLRAKSRESVPPVVAGGGGPGQMLPLNITPEEDIVFTDPDNPDAGLPELATLLSNVKRGPWEESETIAKQRSVREGKPLLIWFTDSVGSPMCKALSQELFSTNDFGNWATEKLVRLRVDASVKVNDPDLDLGATEDRRVAIKNYGAELKKRYKVLGYPSLVLLSPSGEVLGRYRGYKRGEADFLWGQLKHGEAVSSEAYKGWRSGLEKKGYREWHDRKDRKIFAKLTSYSKGTLTFIEPDGTRSKTQETNLSDKDREWIAEQKKIRNM
jgi:thioredoxin-related protein